MSIIKQLEQDIKKIIKELGYELDSFILQKSARPDLGEYQINDCMNLAKKYHENPREIADKIKIRLQQDDRLKEINVAGPGFINISLKDEFLIRSMNKLKENIQNNIDKPKKKKIIIDYGGANVAKTLHVGHLRSANLGEALKRLARTLGYEVISDAHLGDYGRPLGLVMLEIQKRYPDLPYFDPNYHGNYQEIDLPITNSDLEKIYPIASNKAKEDDEYLKQARMMTTRLQQKQAGYYDLWKKIMEISKKEIKNVYDRLNVYYDLWEGESDAVDYIPEVLEIGKKKNIIEESDGAMIIEVKNDEDTSPMPPLLLVKSNKTFSYETTDLATILEREKKFHPDEIWYCADARQELHFEQVFRAARKLQLTKEEVKLEYIGFGTMNGQDGKPFKTRDGGVMSLNELIHLVKESTRGRINYDIVKESEIEDTVDKIAISALKYADFIPFRTTDYIFNPEKFSDVEGKTGPYLLYSTMRMNSLLNKSKEYKQDHYIKINNDIDKEIILTLLDMPGILTKSLKTKSLNEIADYLYLLTNKYNKFYAENKILLERDHQLQESWLVLTRVVYNTNRLLLDILGLVVPEKM